VVRARSAHPQAGNGRLETCSDEELEEEEDVMRFTRITAITLASLLVAGAVVVAFVARGRGAAAETAGAVDPADFSAPVPNPYFPLVAGTVLRYRGSEDGERFREHLTITHHTKTILGVSTVVVRDVLRRSDGTLAEKTHDWYADDNAGNVWYFGERTATYDRHGHVRSREGSWQAGVDGAVAGTIMPAHPHPTDAYRQEFYRGHAEDQAWIVLRGFRVRVPYRVLKRAVRSFEWTRLEPDVISMKVYAPGFGIVKEQDVAGGNERFVLVGVSRP
jgi:hypothetical protein